MQRKTNLPILITSILMSCFSSFTSYGQSEQKAINKLYFQMATGGTSHNGGSSELSIQAALKNNWVTTLSYHSLNMEPKNLPKDFDPGSTMILFFGFEGTTPEVNMNVYSLTAGKVLKAGKHAWFTAEAGISIVNGEKFQFTKKVQTSWWLLVGETSANYDYTTQKQSSAGAMFKADFNWAFSSVVGLGVGTYANINSIESPVGFQVKLICGWMNRGKKHK